MMAGSFVHVQGGVAAAFPFLVAVLFCSGSTAPGLAFGGVLVDVPPPFEVVVFQNGSPKLPGPTRG